MNAGLHEDVIDQIKKNISWNKLPKDIKQLLGNSQKEYENAILIYSLENNIRYRNNLISSVEKDEKQYYERMVAHCNMQMMLFPYHLSDIYIRGLRLTPFIYYKKMLLEIMKNEKSYDSIPNFSALDILRLLDIGRNQYIDLMNECRSGKKLLDSKSQNALINKLLPSQPVLSQSIVQRWWLIKVGHVTIIDADLLSLSEKTFLDELIDTEGLGDTTIKGSLNVEDEPKEINRQRWEIIEKLYARGLIYFDIPIEDSDIFIVPPLKSFVMNRLQGDSVENLLYSIFAVLDPGLTVRRLAEHVLSLDIEVVKRGVSLLNRLGLASRYKHCVTPMSGTGSINKGLMAGEEEDDVTSNAGGDDRLSIDSLSLNNDQPSSSVNVDEAEVANKLENLSTSRSRTASFAESPSPSPRNKRQGFNDLDCLLSYPKKIGLVFDSTLAAFLMMGNLSQGLKTHAITMFETGKLPWESLQDFLKLLEQVDIAACLNDDIKIYANVSQALKNTLLSLVGSFTKLQENTNQNNCNNNVNNKGDGATRMCVPLNGLDMLKCESFEQINRKTCDRILEKYGAIIYLSPISKSICPILNLNVPTFGPCIPEMETPWLRLFLCHILKCGSISILFTRGTRVTVLPPFFKKFPFLSISTWQHETIIVPVETSLLAINDLLTLYPILVQPYALSSLENSTENFLSAINANPDQILDDKFDKNNSLVSTLTLDLPFPLSQSNLVKLDSLHLDSQLISLYNDVTELNYCKHSTGYVRFTKLPKVDIANFFKNGEILKKYQVPIIDQDIASLWDLKEDTDNSIKDNQDELIYEYEWVPYDFHFGIPLFELSLNATIIEAIKNNDLLSHQNLNLLKDATLKFVTCFRRFIQSCQYLPDQNTTPPFWDFNFPNKERDKFKDFTYPRNNLLFYNDTVLQYIH